MTSQEICNKIKKVLTPDLLKPKYRFMHDIYNPTAGHCYHAAEAAFHLLGGKEAGWIPHVFREDDGITHWWIARKNEIVDPTADQYYTLNENPPYSRGKGCGFMTKIPSRRAREIINRITK